MTQFLHDYPPHFHASESLSPPVGVESGRLQSAIDITFWCTSLWQLLPRHLEWSRLQRAVTLLISFVLLPYHALPKNDGVERVGNLSEEEASQARLRLVRMVQKQAFGEGQKFGQILLIAEAMGDRLWQYVVRRGWNGAKYHQASYRQQMITPKSHSVTYFTDAHCHSKDHSKRPRKT